MVAPWWKIILEEMQTQLTCHKNLSGRMAGEAYLERLSRQLRIEIEMIRRTSVVLNRYTRTTNAQKSKPYLHESWLDLVQSL